MQRDPETARVVGVVEEFLRGMLSFPPHHAGDAFVREMMSIEVATAPPGWTPFTEDGRLRFVGLHNLYDDEKGALLIDRAASGDLNADIVLAAFASAYVKAGLALPPRLRGYIVRKLSTPMKTGKPWPKPARGPKCTDTATRDFGIAVSVAALKKRGFNVRSARAQHSAASIVADALTNLGITLDDRSIERIWRDNRAQVDWYVGAAYARFFA